MENQERQYFARPQPQNYIQQAPDGRFQYAPLGPLPNLPVPIQPMQQMQFAPISAPVMNPELYETKKLRDKWAKWVKVASYLMLIVGILDISVGLYSYASQDEHYESHQYQIKISTCDIIVKVIADTALIGASMLGLKASRKKDSVSARKYLRALMFLAIFLIVANLVYGFILVNEVKGAKDNNWEPDYYEGNDEPYDENNSSDPYEPSSNENSNEENFENKIQESHIPPPSHEGEEGSVPPHEAENFPSPPEDPQKDAHRPPCHKHPQNSNENDENLPNGEEHREHGNRHHQDEEKEKDHKKKHHHDEEVGDEGHKKKHHQNEDNGEEEREHDHHRKKDHKEKHHSEQNDEVDGNANHEKEEEHERSHHNREEGKNHHKGGCHKGDKEKGKHHQGEETSESESSQGEEHAENHETEESEDYNDGEEHNGEHYSFESMIVACTIINIICTLGLCGCYIGCAKKLYKNSKKFEVLASQNAPAPQNFIQPIMSQPVLNQPIGVQMRQFNAAPMGSMQYPSFAPVGSVVNPN
ncbi:unnamed protein product [Blepharisma stoltei]|uniref:Uncharacterized protein n=1 Tax=Blepharisma stoltei TaxID=1481888 RepID=A0AAU9IUM9_9CILI|nr:unnamed protein product [Blepharisma stoltei]